jgi:hypothetical protein
MPSGYSYDGSLGQTPELHSALWIKATRKRQDSTSWEGMATLDNNCHIGTGDNLSGVLARNENGGFLYFQFGGQANANAAKRMVVDLL